MSGGSENVPPGVMRAVWREVAALVAEPPDGIELLPHDQNTADVHALIHGPAETPYAGGVWKIRMVISREYPSSPPRAYFLTKIFHPNVAQPSGEVCVDTLQREWAASLGLRHALVAIRCLLIAPNPDSALNADAAALLRDHYNAYAKRAAMFTQIHAAPQHSNSSRASNSSKDSKSETKEEKSNGAGEGPSAKRERPTTSKPAASKDKRRALKRL